MNPDRDDPALPALIETRAALLTQLTALSHALTRLEQARGRVPMVGPEEQWRGLAHSAYRASVGDLARHLDEAITTVSLARQSTSRAIASIAARVE